MGTRVMRVDWHEPVLLHVQPDATDPRASQLRRSGDSAVQLLVGSDVAVSAWVPDAAGPVPVAVGSVLPRVASVEVTTIDVDADGVDSDETILKPKDGTRSDSASASPMTRADNDVADTVIGARRRRAVAAHAPVSADVPSASAVQGTSDVPGASVVPPLLPPIPAGDPAPAQTSAVAAPNAVVFSDGRVVALDRTVYVGRSPRSPRITSGRAPELIAVASPLREVSATHLEIQQEGRAVVVRDLGSTNGTRVTAPGAAPTLLGPGSSRVVSAGTSLDLGDGVVLEIVASTGGASW